MRNPILNALKLTLTQPHPPMLVVAGPCVIRSLEETDFIASSLTKNLAHFNNKIKFIFKASYDKANRSSIHSYRGVGLEKGLDILDTIRNKYQIPILTDVHETNQVQAVTEVVDIVQIPAFLCRQTDLIVESAKTKAIVNVKKGQFMSPYGMRHIADKIRSVSDSDYIFTERGSTFGYDHLMNDFKAIPIMKQWSRFVLYDATHSLQGDYPEHKLSRAYFSHILSQSAMAAGANGLYLEVHPNPASSLSDSKTIFPLSQVHSLIQNNLKIYTLINSLSKPPC